MEFFSQFCHVDLVGGWTFLNKGFLKGCEDRWSLGMRKRTTQQMKFYFQLFETPINYNIIRKLALGPQGLALRGGSSYILEHFN